ncbi:hypothetical protein ACFQ4O_17500 [Methylopila musalis]|uniref:DUF1254 domain-containing protein n=1 Tax=Methylopila musalis TaxID=1134781 RepID=A0ABW3ZC13_9HYPH
MTRLAYALAVALALAGLIHVASLLAVPRFAERGPYERLAALPADGRFAALPDEGDGADVLPFRDPAFVEAVCRYDVSAGPATVTATLPPSYGAVAFHTREGLPFYALTDRAATGGRVEVTVLNAAQAEKAEEEAEEEEAVEPRPRIRIVSPTDAGFVLLRLFAPAPSARPGLVETALSARCGPAAP